MLSLIENAVDFKDLEKKVYGYFCNKACEYVEMLLALLFLKKGAALITIAGE